MIAQAPVIQQIFVIGLPSEIPAPVPAPARELVPHRVDGVLSDAEAMATRCRESNFKTCD